MIELRKLTADDYDTLLNLLNEVFAREHGHPMDFLNELPKMWIRDDRHMGYHTGLFEDGRLVSVAGCYPFTLKIGDTSLLFATTGNVATLPEYEGRGHFTAVFTKIMDELEQMGADGARLGGARQRYARFGYEPAGSTYTVTLSRRNREQYFHDAGKDIVFREIAREDAEALSFCHELSRRSAVYVERSPEDHERDVYLALCSKHAAPYLAVENGEPVGYLAAASDQQFIGRSVDGPRILEWNTVSSKYTAPMLCAWQRRVKSNVTFLLGPHMQEELRLFAPAAEYVSLSSSHRIKVLNYVKLADALLKLKASQRPLLKGKYVIGIEDYGAISLEVSESGASCVMSKDAPDVTLDRLSATRLLFGCLPPSCTLASPGPLPESWLPLPFSWNTLDYV
ncbi:MAG: GNAT family N-acetyltransferase [Clostridia bacterium]|nr:GNAT family N-acetyltransferase [Clostridia bacterium]